MGCCDRRYTGVRYRNTRSGRRWLARADAMVRPELTGVVLNAEA